MLRQAELPNFGALLREGPEALSGWYAEPRARVHPTSMARDAAATATGPDLPEEIGARAVPELTVAPTTKRTRFRLA